MAAGVGPWVLIIILNTTGGKFVDKLEIKGFGSKQQCQAAQINGFNQWKLEKVCVTRAHFEGRTIDPGVAPD